MRTGEPVCVVRLGALGDVVLTTGVLRYWNEVHALRFCVITRAAFAQVFDAHPAVESVVAVDETGETTARGSFPAGLWRELAARNRGRVLIDLHGTSRSRLLALLWRGPVRRYAKHSLARRLFLLSGGRLGGGRLRACSVTQRYALALEERPPPCERLTPRLWLRPEEDAQGRALAARANGGGAKPLIALHPFAAHKGKTWPEEYWRALMARLDARNLDWCVIGQGRFAGVPERRDCTGRTIRQSAGLLAACAALVSGDSGPVHLAAAVDTPVVALFGPTTREWGFYPVGGNNRILELALPCRPCALHGEIDCALDHACLKGIGVEEVMRAIESVAGKVERASQA
jgi:ADP-heptose:LPS heptosyltransferase